MIHGLGHLTDSLTQVVVPGSAELNLQPGRYAVFLEEQSTVNGKIYSTTQSINGLSCRVTSVQSGAAIAMEQAASNTTYDVNGRSGHSVLEFPIQQTGKYLFACDYGTNPKGPDVAVAVGSGVGETIFRIVAVALAAFFGGGGTGVVAIVIVVLRHEREKSRLRPNSASATHLPSAP